MTVGRVITVDDVDRAVVDFLDANFGPALDDVAAQMGISVPARPREILVTAADDADAFTAVTPPFLVVVSPGAEAVDEVNWKTSISWVVGVAAVVASRDERSTRQLCAAYTAAARAVLIQTRTLGVDFVDRVEVTGERYDTRHEDGTRKRTWQLGLVMASIVTPEAVDVRPPTSDGPVVLSHHEEVTPRIGEP